MLKTVMTPAPAYRSIAFALLGCIALAGCQSRGPDLALDAPDAPAKRMVTQGAAKKIIAQNLTRCDHTRHPCSLAP